MVNALEQQVTMNKMSIYLSKYCRRNKINKYWPKYIIFVHSFTFKWGFLSRGACKCTVQLYDFSSFATNLAKCNNCNDTRLDTYKQLVTARIRSYSHSRRFSPTALFFSCFPMKTPTILVIAILPFTGKVLSRHTFILFALKDLRDSQVS